MIMSEQPPQPPQLPPQKPPVYPLDYASPQNQRSGMPTAMKIILITLLVLAGLGLLAFGLCMAALRNI